METLIRSDDTWTLWAVIVAGVAASIWLEQTFRWAARLSGPVVGCASRCCWPTSHHAAHASVYDTVQDSRVPLALPLLLFRAEYLSHRELDRLVVRGVSSRGGRHGRGRDHGGARAAIGRRCAQVAAIMTASYIGGGVNFVAVAVLYDMSGNTTDPLLVADNFIMAGAFMALLLICRSRWARCWTLIRTRRRPSTADNWRRSTGGARRLHWSISPRRSRCPWGSSLSRTARRRGLPTGWAMRLDPQSPATVTSTLRPGLMLVATLAHCLLVRIHGAEELARVPAVRISVRHRVAGRFMGSGRQRADAVPVLPDHCGGEYSDHVRRRTVVATGP